MNGSQPEATQAPPANRHSLYVAIGVLLLVTLAVGAVLIVHHLHKNKKGAAPPTTPVTQTPAPPKPLTASQQLDALKQQKRRAVVNYCSNFATGTDDAAITSCITAKCGRPDDPVNYTC